MDEIKYSKNSPGHRTTNYVNSRPGRDRLEGVEVPGLNNTKVVIQKTRTKLRQSGRVGEEGRSFLYGKKREG